MLAVPKLIPIGGGIPAGVLLGKTHHLAVGIVSFLYLVSDVILALVFEPLMFFGPITIRKLINLIQPTGRY